MIQLLFSFIRGGQQQPVSRIDNGRHCGADIKHLIHTDPVNDDSPETGAESHADIHAGQKVAMAVPRLSGAARMTAMAFSCG